MADLPPRKCLVLLFRSLQFAQSEIERHEICRAARAIRQSLLSSNAEGELTVVARRILAKCAGQTLHVNTIARAMGLATYGTPMKTALRQLRDAHYMEKTGRGIYRIMEKPEPDKPDVTPFTKAS